MIFSLNHAHAQNRSNGADFRKYPWFCARHVLPLIRDFASVTYSTHQVTNYSTSCKLRHKANATFTSQSRFFPLSTPLSFILPIFYSFRLALSDNTLLSITGTPEVAFTIHKL